MYKLLLILFMFLNCTDAFSYDFRGVSICGGGYTDKYGVTWDYRNPPGTPCEEKYGCYEPRICDECSSSVPVDGVPKEKWCKSVNPLLPVCIKNCLNNEDPVCRHDGWEKEKILKHCHAACDGYQ